MFATELAIFASRFNIAAKEAYVLPALFERTAELVKMPVRVLLNEATYNNQALGDYLAEAARKVAKEDGYKFGGEQ